MPQQKPISQLIRQGYFLGLVMLAASLTLSPFVMSVAQFWLIGIWIIDAIVNKDFKAKCSRFGHNKAAVLLVAFYLLHVVGLIYTTDFQYAMKDLRVKLPILLLPFLFASTTPLDRKHFNLLMNIYVLSVFVATWFSFAAYLKHDYNDVREISHFISHIRFCLHIVFCMAITAYYLFKRPAKWWSKAIQFAIILWFAYQIYIFESLSGYAVLAAVVVVSILYAFLHWKTGTGWRIAVIAVAVIALAASSITLYKIVKPMLKVEEVNFSTLEKTTAQGNPYWHDTIHNPIEDGRYVGLYYCRTELREAWPQRSSLAFDGQTTNGENLEATLARYLTSKGLRKDAEGVMALTDTDIHNIEQGIANYNNWAHPGVRARLSSTIFEYNLYQRYNNPNGGSLSQRIEYTRASFHIIKQHWLFGVGTGDVPTAFAQTYDEIQSPLNQEFRYRAHNQYLAITVAFGLVGLALFLLALLYPYFSSKKNRHYLYTIFLCIMLLSMFPEDTLETQAGASLFAFFDALLLFSYPTKDSNNIIS